MPSIEGIINILGNIGSDMLEVHEERCVLVRNQHADCLKCAQVCTTGALTYDDNSLTVTPDKCIGCGTCATACPTCALEIKDPPDGQLMDDAKRALIAGQGHATIVCEKMLEAYQAYSESKLGALERARNAGKLAYDASAICCVKCLGRVDEALLCGLAAYGTEDITLVHYACDDCEHAPGGAMAEQVAHSAASLLAAFGSSAQVSLTKRLPEAVQGWHDPGEGQGIGRRQFFTQVAETGAQVAAAALDADGQASESSARSAEPDDVSEEVPEFVAPAYRKVNDDGTLPQFVPERRIRTVNYLQHIGQPVVDNVESRVIGAITIDTDICTGCRMCATFCPTGAIRKVGELAARVDTGSPDKAQPEAEDDGFFGILHRPTLCVQCRLCQNICPEQAIVISDSVPAAQFIGQKAIGTEMPRPSWQANQSDSMFRKVRHIIGADDLNAIQF